MHMLGLGKSINTVVYLRDHHIALHIIDQKRNNKIKAVIIIVCEIKLYVAYFLSQIQRTFQEADTELGS